MFDLHVLYTRKTETTRMRMWHPLIIVMFGYLGVWITSF